MCQTKQDSYVLHVRLMTQHYYIWVLVAAANQSNGYVMQMHFINQSMQFQLLSL
jgi:hypothetical protein